MRPHPSRRIVIRSRCHSGNAWQPLRHPRAPHVITEETQYGLLARLQQLFMPRLSLGITGLLQQFRHIRPQILPRLLFLGCQFLERVRVSNTGQVGVALPVLEC